LPVGSRILAVVAVLLGLAGAALVGRRPLLTLGLLVAGCLAMAATVNTVQAPDDVYLAGHLVAADVALGVVVATRPRWQWFAGLVLVAATLPASQALWALSASGNGVVVHDRFVFWLAFAALPAVVGGLVGFTVRQARQMAVDAASRAVLAERLRISRELHDVVAHSVGVITLQAGAAARVMDTQPERAREAMVAVEKTGRETLSSLRRVLAAFREGTGTQAPRRPGPGLADVGALVASTTAAGVRVDLRWRGERRTLPPDLDLSAFRIIQESLANVVRHAHAASCEVSVAFGAADLAIEVTDRGRGGSEFGSGYGLPGMRERVALLNGSLDAGPRDGGGFRVAARLPLPAGAR